MLTIGDKIYNTILGCEGVVTEARQLGFFANFPEYGRIGYSYPLNPTHIYKVEEPSELDAEPVLDTPPTAGLRYNTGKLPYHLLPEDSVEEMVRVLQFGSIKYDDWNWSKGMKWDSQTASSLQRHLVAWKKGEDFDGETGLHHMAHIMCNAAFLLHFYLNNKGEDDRYKYSQSGGV